MADEQANRIVRVVRVVLWTIFVILLIVVDGGLFGDERLLPASAWGLIRLAVFIVCLAFAFEAGMHFERHKDDEDGE